ncbi:hypothetical protein ElyMa_001279000 [Elysia marginata]|uniref:Uncharacterized protein n=1 Tax=Elysia marginata TaxID=1093978 RepID=A0AAV4IEV1_9GAST|nr:hypothetical protein ElyMa_001279000 [Elysia marginata]
MELDLSCVPILFRHMEMVFLLLVMPSLAWGECLPNPVIVKRSGDYTACSIDKVHQYNITSTRSVPSVTYCGSLCLSDTSCTSFNIIDDGSLSEVREAVLSGATVRLLWEPYPQSADDSLYKAAIYAVDSVKLQDYAPYLTANIYTFASTLSNTPLWEYVKMDTSGNLETKLSNGTSASYSSNSFTWLVQGMSSECFQQEALSHNGAVSKPAFSVHGAQRTGQVSDIIAVLSRGSTARVVSHFGTAGSLAYPAYSLSATDTIDFLSSMSTWIPGEETDFYLPLRIHKLNFSSKASTFETFLDMDTADGGYYEDFAKNTYLTKTEVFLDPCWELKWSVDDQVNTLQGSRESLVSALRSGARLLMVFQQSVFEAEMIELYDDGYFDAYSKMGVAQNAGYTWVKVVANAFGTWQVGNDRDDTPGPRDFYTDKRERPFRLKIESGSVVEGDWAEARKRLKSGLLPRAIVKISSVKSYILEVEAVALNHEYSNTYMQSYRVPDGDGFKVYLFGLDQYMRVDIGSYRGNGANVKPPWTVNSITLLFEDYPLTHEP